MAEDVNHPDHYGGDTDYEVIKVLEAWDLELAKGFCWGNLIKYTARAGKKGSEVADRQKAEWYANRLATITAALEGRKANPAVGRRVKPYAFGAPEEPAPSNFVNAVLGDELANGDTVQDSEGDDWVKAGGTWSVKEHSCADPDHNARNFTEMLRRYGPLTVTSGQYKGEVFPKP